MTAVLNVGLDIDVVEVVDEAVDAIDEIFEAVEATDCDESVFGINDGFTASIYNNMSIHMIYDYL